MSGAARRYVYYRVAEDAVAEVAAFVAPCFEALRQTYPGARFELLRRPQTKDGLATLMEVHAGLADEPTADRVERALAAALAHWLVGPRHVERFVALD